MFCSVNCVTCGYCIGQVATLFEHLKKELLEQHRRKKGIALVMLGSDLAFDFNCEDIFKALKIEHDCCRMHLLTYKIF